MSVAGNDDRPNLVVFGVGHSGTTIVAKMLFALGWHAGEAADAADDEFAENVSIRDCNCHVLDHEEMPAHASALVARLPRPWAVKDPRFVLTLPRWQGAFAACGTMPTLLWLTRELDEVKRSYLRRHEMHGDVPGGHGKTVDELWEAAGRHYAGWPGPKMRLAYEAVDAAAALFVTTGAERADRSISNREVARRLAQFAGDNETLGKKIQSLTGVLRKVLLNDLDRDTMELPAGREEAARLYGSAQGTLQACRLLLDQMEESCRRQVRGQILRVVVSYAVPRDAIVLVVSRGDEEQLNLPGRKGWHFPQAPGGAYAGSYPATSADAIAHLEALRGQGAEFLLFPWESLWWLEHYAQLKQYLECHYKLAGPREDTCLIYDLRRM
jgi:hypothetical protein